MESQQPTHAASHRQQAKRKLPVTNFMIAAVIVLLGAVVAAVLLVTAKGQEPDSSRYQAVFLDNNQVFFGKLKNTSGEYMTLEKAYYTKASDLPADATAEQKAATASNVSLIKVGDEVYGPENVLKIRSEQVLFWQDLKSDSKVAKAIDSAK